MNKERGGESAGGEDERRGRDKNSRPWTSMSTAMSAKRTSITTAERTNAAKAGQHRGRRGREGE